MDTISLKRILSLHPAVRDEVTAIYTEVYNDSAIVGIRIVQGYRTIEEQDQLYAQGRTTPGAIVTKARGGESYHNYGLAIDFALLFKNGAVSWDREFSSNRGSISDWQKVVDIFKKYGWAWGGDFKTIKDYPHFQKSFGYTVQQLKTRFDNGELVRGSYVSLK